MSPPNGETPVRPVDGGNDQQPKGDSNSTKANVTASGESSASERLQLFIRNGWSVFPLVEGAKRPLTKHGHNDATTDLGKIGQWLQQYPRANWAIAAKASGLLFVDVDEKPEKEGGATWAELIEEHGETPTFTVRTASGGRHLYYAQPDTTWSGGNNALGKHVDVPSYVVAPGSTVAGGLYTVEDDRPSAPCPDWLMERLRSRTVGKDYGPYEPGVGMVEATEEQVRAYVQSVADELAAIPDDGGWFDPLMAKVFTVGGYCGSGQIDDGEAADILWSTIESGWEWKGSGTGPKGVEKLIWTQLDAGAARPIVRMERPEATIDDFADLIGWAAEADPLEALFTATPTLATIRQAAYAQVVSAHGLLGYCLARVLAEVPPWMVLPHSAGGGPASLNLGIALTGESGGGKSIAKAVSAMVLGVDQSDVERPVGSGEGVAQTFLRWSKSDRAHVLIQDPRRILSVDEINTLGALNDRSGATILPVLRSALTGGPLGSENATQERRRHVPEGRYRLLMIAGVQPTRSGVLLNSDDAGTPQRFLWVRVVDPRTPDESPGFPEPLMWGLPALPRSRVLDYPDNIKAQVRATLVAKTRGQIGSLESHLNLTRLKVSVALALLHGSWEITDQWWDLAGVLVNESLAVQAECRRALRDQDDAQVREGGRKEVVRELGAATHRQERAMKAAGAVWRKVAKHASSQKDGNDQKHDQGDGCTERCVSRALQNYPDRAELRGRAVEYAVELAWIEQHGDRLHLGQGRPA